MAEIADIDHVRRGSRDDAARPAARPAASHHAGTVPLTAIPPDAWRSLADGAIEPNGYYLPAWELAVNAFAHGRTGVAALAAWNGDTSEPARLTGLLPVVS